ncbi:unnamed protein product [Pipistrellus nathusii]|uniref:Uncharacterized protein n=1 Tax=Pipistrellus nathusii TaxID=59473 RepID=A0ABP0A3G5_PIPNA
MTIRFFQWCWRKLTCWVFFWKHKTKSTVVGHADSEKTALKMESKCSVIETFKFVGPLKEANVSRMGLFPKASDPCTLAKTTDRAKVELDCRSRSLLQLPRSAAKSVSSLMLSALQSGWQMCSWKSSVSSTSVPSEIRTRSPLQSPEAEMLREVYLVLWAIRKQLRQLARRQERRRRHHHAVHANPQPEPVQGLKKDASKGNPTSSESPYLTLR